MIDYTGGSPMGQPGQGNPYNTGMAGPRPSPGFGMGGPGYQAPTLAPNIPMPPPSDDGMDWQAMPGGGYYSNKTPPPPPGGYKVDHFGENNGNNDELIKLLTQMGIAPDLINKLVQPPDPNAMHTMGQGMGQAGRSNLSQFAQRRPNMGGMGTGQLPPSSMGPQRMGNMGGGFGLGPPINSNARQNYNLPQNGGGFAGPNEMGHPMGGGPLASTGMGMQRPSNPMPSMMPSAPPSMGGMSGNQNTGITGGMNKSYSPMGFNIRTGTQTGGGFSGRPY